MSDAEGIHLPGNLFCIPVAKDCLLYEGYVVPLIDEVGDNVDVVHGC